MRIVSMMMARLLASPREMNHLSHSTIAVASALTQPLRLDGNKFWVLGTGTSGSCAPTVSRQ